MHINAYATVGGVKLHPTPHFVPEGISSSGKDFIILVFILSFNGLFFLRNKVPQKI